jgi:hypothetical protein
MSAPPPDPAPLAPFGTAQMLTAEYRAIHGATDADFATVADYQAHVLDIGHPMQAALSLSGGGIRSAAYALGVLQAFAKETVLDRFHYLSTVSGGGYIGAWLQRWLHEDGIAAVQAALPGLPPAPPVAEVRNYTSYLTPRPGLASPDTWAGVVLWLRNVAINALIFMPALLALALLPRAYALLLADTPRIVAQILLLAGLLLLGLATCEAARRMPSHAGTLAADPDGARRDIRRLMVAPAVAWSLLLPFALRRDWPSGPTVIGIAAFVTLIAGYAIATRGAVRRGLFLDNAIAWVIAAFCSAFALQQGSRGILALEGRLGEVADAAGPMLAMVLKQVEWAIGRTEGRSMVTATIAAPVLAMASTLLLNTVFVALRKEAALGDLDREWLARLSAVKLVPMLLLAAFSIVCVYGPQVSFAGLRHVYGQAAAAVTAVSGVLAAVAGASGRSSALDPGRLFSMQRLATVATFVFGIGLFAALASLGTALVLDLPRPHWIVRPVLAGVLLAVAYGFGARVNVNRFSMHGVYRNRLARAFLGSARRRPDGMDDPRHPDPFTGFAADDNIPLAALRERPNAATGNEASGTRLFPVIGAALNLTADGAIADSAAERKAAPWTFTPLACGSVSLRDGRQFVDSARWGADPVPGAAPEVSQGITLATAMTISGAAVSPNMGYHSSPATSFLLTLFNVRLGAWLPNPARLSGRALEQGRPPNALTTLAREMLGRAGIAGPAVYLSDGGHFDNLGLYEMVRRGCRLIVVVDAGCDPQYDYADLGSTLRRIRIDLATEIVFDIRPVRARPWAIATITYPVGGPGTLLYLKPTLPDDARIDLTAYRAADSNFPFDSTADQMFTESQFESYRALGRDAAASLFGERAHAKLDNFFATLRR